MKNILRLGVILFAITAIAGFLLGVVYSVTKGPIEELQAKMQLQAMRETLPQAERFESVSVPENQPLVTSLSVGYAGDQIVGWNVTAAPKGYGGAVSIMVGVSAEKKIQGIKILSHTETPGLGANSTRPEFAQQFAGKTAPLSVTKGVPAGNEIQALTGATITSNAVVAGVNAALEAVLSQEKGAQL